MVSYIYLFEIRLSNCRIPRTLQLRISCESHKTSLLVLTFPYIGMPPTLWVHSVLYELQSSGYNTSHYPVVAIDKHYSQLCLITHSAWVYTGGSLVLHSQTASSPPPFLCDIPAYTAYSCFLWDTRHTPR